MSAEMAKRARVERAIQELDVFIRLLTAALLAVSARGLIGGLTVGIAIIWALAAVLLSISIALVRRGRRLVRVLSPELMPSDQVL